MLKVIEKCRLSPPPATVGEKSLQLTFFDMMWLQFSPVHQLFLYEFPHSRTHFIETTIPKLKQSLSITLQHFFPFASNLIVYPKPNSSGFMRKPEIRHVEGDSVAVTFVECDHLDFDDLVGNHSRDCDKFYQLIPLLGRATTICDYVTIPLFSLQVTFFPNCGISIGITNHHTLCDARSKFDFLTAWTSIAKHGTDEQFSATGSLPFCDRVIKYPNSLDEIYLNQPSIESINANYHPHHLASHTSRVRATLVLTRTQINRLKKWVSIQKPTLEYISSFSVACAYVWSCIAKSRAHVGEENGETDLEGFLCAIDWRSRFNPPISDSYFGNCVKACRTTMIKSKLLSGNQGLVIASELLGKSLSEMLKKNDGLIKDAETGIESAFDEVSWIGVAGTPKTKIYDIDLGWGKPKKYEIISLDYNRSISLNACKESPEDFEIGLCLPAKQMDAFFTISRYELEITFPGLNREMD